MKELRGDKTRQVRITSGGKDAASGRSGAVPPETLRALRAGDHEAFVAVFMAYYEKVKHFIFLLVKSSDTAEEMSQDLFANLWQFREKIDPERNFNSYIYTIARNNVLNYIKHERARSRYQQGLWDWDLDASTSEEILLSKEVDLLIDLLVSKMPRQRRKIFELYRSEGMSNEEIARELSITTNAVNKQLRLAVADIKDVLNVVISILMA